MLSARGLTSLPNWRAYAYHKLTRSIIAHPNNVLLTCRTLASKSNASNSSKDITKEEDGVFKVEKRTGLLDLSEFTVGKVRSFTICAHVDHGKSTLADRLLEITGTIETSHANKQVLDSLQVERERGITVKAQTVSMLYKGFLLNLIDTPGHVDFNYEVRTSLAACQGALLLVDSTQGVQAQTMANYRLALDTGCKILPVLTKIDLSSSMPDVCLEQMKSAFKELPADVVSNAMWLSAKSGEGVDDVLPAIIEHVPQPSADALKPFRALIFDSWYDRHRGVICLIAVLDGAIRKGDKIQSAHSKLPYDVGEVGILRPAQTPCVALLAGHVGYVIAGMKRIDEAYLGDTLHAANVEVQVHPGFQRAKAVVFSGIYPMDPTEYDAVKSAIEKLVLTDPSVEMGLESSHALGSGFRLGFLGMLHLDVFTTRLEQEHNISVISTPPSVRYQAVVSAKKNIGKRLGAIIEDKDADPNSSTQKIAVNNPSEWPSIADTISYLEPVIRGTLIFPAEFLGPMMELCEERRGVQEELTYLDSERILLRYKLPMNEILVDFFDQIKVRSSGYASFDYEDAGFEPADIVRLEIWLHHKPIDALSTIVHSSKAESIGRSVCEKLKESVPRQQFEVAVQAVVNGKVLARETVKAVRKNVTAKCYGGDVSRKMKLLARQKEGKKRMRMVGDVAVSQETFMSVITSSNPSSSTKKH